MFLRMLQKANYLITKYEVFDFPVPIEIIEQIITNHKYKLVILNNLKSGCIIANSIIVPSTNSSCTRENMTHEYGHASNHCHNFALNDIIQISKNEAQANAFAAYFLMPVFIFESDLLQGYNDFELSENFGVTIKFVRYRKTLTESLIHIGYFDEIYNNKVIK